MYLGFGEFAFPGFQRRRLVPLANIVPSTHRSVTVTESELSFHLYRQCSSDTKYLWLLQTAKWGLTLRLWPL